MAQSSRRTSGFLLLADISGYTAFLTGSELEHAQGIIEDLMRAILGALIPPLKLVKLEGDAVFAHSAGATLSTDRILDLMERTYFDFSDCRDTMQRRTTCTCAACANIPSLDLKFLVHRGEYVTHLAVAWEDLAGPDVILVHRLLKNHVREATGVPAYAFLTSSALGETSAACLRLHTEETESFGEVQGGVLDLRASLARLRDERRVRLAASECDYAHTTRVPVPLAVAWEWWTNPALAPLWQSDMLNMRLARNESGRQGVGSVMHCAHGSFDTLARYVDWRPFEYFSAERVATRKSFTAPPELLETVEFRADGEGTEIAYRLRLKERGLGTRLKLRMMRPVLNRMFNKHERDLNALLTARAAEATTEDAAAPVGV